MNFRNWLLNEGVSLQAKPGLESVLPQAEQALRTYLSRYGGPEMTSAFSRYQFTLEKYDNSYWDYDTFSFGYSPIEKNRGRDEIAEPDDTRWQYYSDWDGKTGYRMYKTPKDAIEEIPANPNYGYRGMSWEEWQKLQKTGLIQSFGSHNFSNQENLTFYGYKPDTGESYAGSFAPMPFKPTPLKPGVIIAVPRQFLKDNSQNSNIPRGELAHEGPLSAKEIAEVYMLVATKSRQGKFDLMVNRQGKVSEGSRSNVSVSYAIRRLR